MSEKSRGLLTLGEVLVSADFALPLEKDLFVPQNEFSVSAILLLALGAP